MSDGQPVEMPVGVVDLDNTTTSRGLVRRLDAFQTSHVVARYPSVSAARHAIQQNQIYAFLYIPKGTTDNLLASRQPKISFYYTMTTIVSGSLVFRDMKNLSESGRPREFTQDMKNTYISVPVDLKFSAERFNNYRPYVMAGVNPMVNLAGKDQDYLQLKRYDLMLEVGMGCDFYLPFFKLIPELKFCYGLANTLDKSHTNELTDVNKRMFSQSVTSARTKMIVLTLYFE
jgi:hypothetical protein